MCDALTPFMTPSNTTTEVTMDSQECLPFHYPTSICLVDDSADFLYNFRFQLDESLPVISFQSPTKALKYLQSSGVDPRVERRDFVLEHKEHFGHPTLEHVIGLDLSAIYLQMYRPERFDETSVLVVDYQMGEMNGLELCEQLADSPVRKILLTGKADAGTAIRAFNDGLIDRFVEKSDPQALEKVQAYIKELDQEYFREASSLLIRALSVDTPSLLQMPAFVDFFRHYRKENGIVEHYLVANPMGFLLLDRQAQASLMLVVSPEELELHRMTAVDEGAPQAMVDRLGSGEVVPFFPQTDGYYRQGVGDWELALRPAGQIVTPGGIYLYAVLGDTSPYNTASGTIRSLNEHLKSLQQASEQGSTKGTAL